MVATYRIASPLKVTSADFLFVTIEYGRDSVAHELPNKRVPGGTGIDLQAMVTRQVMVSQEATEQADVLKCILRQSHVIGTWLSALLTGKAFWTCEWMSTRLDMFNGASGRLKKAAAAP
jgi:hypothetical protein